MCWARPNVLGQTYIYVTNVGHIRWVKPNMLYWANMLGWIYIFVINIGHIR